jgi:hypothetical protein
VVRWKDDQTHTVTGSSSSSSSANQSQETTESNIQETTAEEETTKETNEEEEEEEEGTYGGEVVPLRVHSRISGLTGAMWTLRCDCTTTVADIRANIVQRSACHPASLELWFCETGNYINGRLYTVCQEKEKESWGRGGEGNLGSWGSGRWMGNRVGGVVIGVRLSVLTVLPE